MQCPHSHVSVSTTGQVIRTFQGKVPVDYACTRKIGKVCCILNLSYLTSGWDTSHGIKTGHWLTMSVHGAPQGVVPPVTAVLRVATSAWCPTRSGPSGNYCV